MCPGQCSLAVFHYVSSRNLNCVMPVPARGVPEMDGHIVTVLLNHCLRLALDLREASLGPNNRRVGPELL